MGASQILVIDDELAIRQVLASYISDAGYCVEQASNGAEALAKLSKGDIDIALCDIKMPDISGIEVLRKIQSQNLNTTFIMMTAFASVNTAIEAMKAGAYDYIIKPLREEDVIHRIVQLDNTLALKDENLLLRNMVLKDQNNFFRCQSSAMLHVERLISKVAPMNNTVLITGESGVGKGVITRAIHQQSPISESPFIPVNCGAIPENLMESEFFGHVKGAFTGAVKAKKGLFLAAHNGSIFLDEISELPIHLQVKLLHAIEDKKIRPVGSEKERHVDVRIIAATNSDLDKMVEEGKFRKDLYFRINVFNIHIPPLRERREDIACLIKFFMQKEAKKMSVTGEPSIEPDAEEFLISYEWPGNIRELENVISRTLALAEDSRITISSLPPHITKIKPSASAESPQESTASSFREQIRSFEINVIKRAIERALGNRRIAAQNLGIGLSTLYRKIEENEELEGEIRMSLKN